MHLREPGGCAFRRSRPGIPSEGGRLYRLKPAWHSDDAGHLVGRVLVSASGISSADGIAVKLLPLGGGFAKAFPLESKPMGVVDEAIKNGIGDGEIANDFVPVLDG